MSVDEAQDEIMMELSSINKDIEAVLCYIINTGKGLPDMPPAFKTDGNLIKGCHAKVWLSCRTEENRIFFYADSDTIISRGLAGLLVRVFSGQMPDEILNSNIYFIHKYHLDRFIGTKRSAGLSAMIDQIKTYSRAMTGRIA
ncbi:MAG TPA: SufE family protein [Chryseolinea sp.]